MRSSWQISLALLLAGLILTLPVYVTLAGGLWQEAAEGQVIFESKCAACHSIGEGQRMGPDLKGVTDTRSAEWLAAFITNPQKMVDAGDQDAVQLVKEYNNVVMPSQGLSAAEVAAVILYLQGPDRAPSSAGGDLPEGNPAHGEKLFTGEVVLANGGTACISCHTVGGTGWLGGGSLGPDLTPAYFKFGYSAGMKQMLASLPFPTMQGIYNNKPLTPKEQADLGAFFQQASQEGRASFPAAGLVLWTAGFAGVGCLFGVIYFAWRKQHVSFLEKLRKSRT